MSLSSPYCYYIIFYSGIRNTGRPSKGVLPSVQLQNCLKIIMDALQDRFVILFGERFPVMRFLVMENYISNSVKVVEKGVEKKARIRAASLVDENEWEENKPDLEADLASAGPT